MRMMGVSADVCGCLMPREAADQWQGIPGVIADEKMSEITGTVLTHP